ncbi:DUF899 domain-containing protein [Paludisphaera mucosa]|uniref:Thioredoxin family protein n=1 Tax=Paludisphaera mucosa TaxID=3030827 RepID=A0ABT6F3Z3_9BACT|nr:thioredoxin family protein [Paludisphaera mucosa]MDG3002222.1 thioredoxin family protein [Paludisphaera mucosa]
MADHPVVSREEWTAARKDLLEKEKRLTRLRDELSRERRALPWVKVEKTYVFEGPNGPETLADLFAGRSQLIIHHFMFSPDWEEGCVGCSFQSDHVEGALVHLENHDVSFVRVSRAPLAKLQSFKKRMGWGTKWVSSFGSPFNYDYHVSFPKDAPEGGEATYNYAPMTGGMEELPGLSVFVKDGAGDVFHTYSCFARGDEGAVGAYFYMDLTPKGRDETGPHRNLMDWVRHHDRYDEGFVDATSLYRTGKLVYESRP